LGVEVVPHTLPGGGVAVRVAFAGRAGCGSDGNGHGDQMRAVVRAALDAHAPPGLIVDLLELEYTFGNWIGVWLSSRIPPGRTCLLASGRTWERLAPLWVGFGLDRVIPAFHTLEDALRFITSGAASR
jgi:hypothetical protein